MNIRLPARIGAIACIGVAITMGVLALREEPEPAPLPRIAPAQTAADPLLAKLIACQQAGEAAASDRSCLAAWAENRRRFLGTGRTVPAEPVPDIGPAKSSEPAPLEDDAAPTSQEQ